MKVFVTDIKVFVRILCQLIATLLTPSTAEL